MDALMDEVIEEWFGTEPTPTKEIHERWFTKDPAYDEQLRARFGALHAEAAAGRLAEWRGSARGELALIVLLDQLSRNLFRDDPRAFANDVAALALSREMQRSRRARELTLHQQMVTLMPFQHAEDRAAQAEGVAAFAMLVERARASGAVDVVEMMDSALAYARRHAAIIERFGRFPHRNAVLGRASTAEELAYLKEPGSSF